MDVLVVVLTTVVVVPVVSVVVAAPTGWNRTVVAPASVIKFVHIVLKWMHRLEEE